MRHTCNRPSFTTIPLYWGTGAPVIGPNGPSTVIVVLRIGLILGSMDIDLGSEVIDTYVKTLEEDYVVLLGEQVGECAPRGLVSCMRSQVYESQH